MFGVVDKAGASPLPYPKMLSLSKVSLSERKFGDIFLASAILSVFYVEYPTIE